MYLQGVGTRDFPEDNGTLGGRFKECKRYLCRIKLQCMYNTGIFYLYPRLYCLYVIYTFSDILIMEKSEVESKIQEIFGEKVKIILFSV